MKCSKCKVVKPDFHDMYFVTTGSTGVEKVFCKKCFKKYSKELRKKLLNEHIHRNRPDA